MAASPKSISLMDAGLAGFSIIRFSVYLHKLNRNTVDKDNNSSSDTHYNHPCGAHGHEVDMRRTGEQSIAPPLFTTRASSRNKVTFYRSFVLLLSFASLKYLSLVCVLPSMFLYGLPALSFMLPFSAVLYALPSLCRVFCFSKDVK